MKKEYQKPVIEFEVYSMDEAIAANCTDKVGFGPGDYTNYVCDGFEKDDFEVALYSLRSSGTSFYNGENGPACSCYYSSGGEGYFTS